MEFNYEHEEVSIGRCSLDLQIAKLDYLINNIEKF
jgi:hypothetical protein